LAKAHTGVFPPTPAAPATLPPPPAPAIAGKPPAPAAAPTTAPAEPPVPTIEPAAPALGSEPPEPAPAIEPLPPAPATGIAPAPELLAVEPPLLPGAAVPSVEPQAASISAPHKVENDAARCARTEKKLSIPNMEPPAVGKAGIRSQNVAVHAQRSNGCLLSGTDSSTSNKLKSRSFRTAHMVGAALITLPSTALGPRCLPTIRVG